MLKLKQPFSWTKPAPHCFHFSSSNFTCVVESHTQHRWRLLLRPPPTLSSSWPWPCRNISHIQVFSCELSLPNSSIKLNLGLQAGGRLLIANHLDQSNYLVNKYDLTLLIRLSQGSERCAFFQGPSSYFTHEPRPRFPVYGHVLSVGGDGLSVIFFCQSMNEKGKLETWITSEKISYGLEHALKNPGILFSAFWFRSIVEEPTDTFLGLLAKIKCWRTHGYHLMDWQFTLHSWYGIFCRSSHFVQRHPQRLTSTQDTRATSQLLLLCCYKGEGPAIRASYLGPGGSTLKSQGIA
jgi:hypothetical protein